MSTRYQTDDLRITAIKEVIAPETLLNDYPITDQASETVALTRRAIHNILNGEDDRLLVIIGPCSIHDPKAALEYAARLKKLRDELQDNLLIVMRVYFEKPRTTVGWKGLINDPHLNGSFEINEGLHQARKVLLDINNMGMPAGTEYLDLITPQYISDLVSWGAIGARTTESQAHRELASGLSCPVGFKNATNGSMRVALDAIRSSSRPHHFLSVTKEGRSAIFSTHGNEDCHVILRGGSSGPNYDAESIARVSRQLADAGLPDRIMVDCSHANSGKDHERQPIVAADLARQIAAGNHALFGLMMESFLVDGNQKHSQAQGAEGLVYGQSITDKCMSWERTEPIFEQLAEAVRARRSR